MLDAERFNSRWEYGCCAFVLLALYVGWLAEGAWLALAVRHPDASSVLEASLNAHYLLPFAVALAFQGRSSWIGKAAFALSALALGGALLWLGASLVVAAT